MEGESRALSLPGYQKKQLRGLAHALEPVVLVGQAGVTAEVIDAVDRALGSHELIKVRLREPEDKKRMAAALSEATRSCLCGLVGHTVILYRPHPEEPKIELHPSNE